MTQFNLEELISNLVKNCSVEFKNFNLKKENEIELFFEEFVLSFKLENLNFIIKNFNVYGQFRFNKRLDFISLGEKIINFLISYLKKLGFVLIIAFNILSDALNFWRRLNFEIRVEDSIKVGYFNLR